MQLQGIIGKLKREKYGVKILEEIKKYDESEHQCQETLATEQDGDHRAKKQKTQKSLVVIDSSEDDKEWTMQLPLQEYHELSSGVYVTSTWGPSKVQCITSGHT